VFEPHTGRRIVLATNVAETSLTVPGIRYVVDPGTARISRYSRRTKVQRLPIESISRASADQRAGRCGRLGPGICIRLFSEDDYLGRPEFTEPEILRTNLASVILQMAALDLGDVESFPFLDPPDPRAVRDGVALLHELGAVDPARQGTGRWLTAVGRQLARLPLDPRLGRMVIEAERNACLREALVITAALSIQDPRERPTDQEAHADQLHARFRDEASDFLGWLNLWEYLHDERRSRTSGEFRRMCREEFLNYRRVREWQDVHAQLIDIVDDLGFALNREPADPDAVHRSLLAGLLSQVGRRDPDGYEYRGARGARFALAPGSALFKRAPEWVMAAELVETSRLWARGIAQIPAGWVEQVGAHVVQRSHGEARWDPDRGSAVTTEAVTLFGIPLVTDRTVQLGPIDPAAARELFIRHALVAGEWDTHHEFALHNAERIEEVRALEARGRRADLLVSEDTIFSFFEARVPGDVTSARHFDRWWNTVRGDDPHLLDLSLDDLVEPTAEPIDEEAFPVAWRHGDLTLPLAYEFDPNSPTDGITVDVPLHGLDRVDPAALEWNVPGRRAELIEALVRSLPKAHRKRFVPISDTVARLLASIDRTDGSPVHAVRRGLIRLGGTAIPPDAFDLDAVPRHLRPRFRVLDEDGTVLAEGDDLRSLKVELVASARETATEGSHELEQSGLLKWSIGELPKVVEIGEPGRRALTYPALVDEGDSVAVRLLATPEEQAEAMWVGTRRLLLLNLPSPAKLLRPLLTDAALAAIRSGPHATAVAWVEDCIACSVDGILVDAGGPPWDGVAFDALLDRTRAELADRATEVGAESVQLLGTLRSVRSQLGGLSRDRFPGVADDVEQQVARLAYPGFLTAIGADRVADVLRYLRAAHYRLERVADHPERDRQSMALMHRLEREYERLLESLPRSPDLLDVAWMLEELRVSLFAQPLGTRGKVSPQRIQRALADLISG
jgi:ATP-dependent helicase HrpA